MIHFAVRFLPTSLTAIVGFMDAYFDGYMQRDNERICPPAKLLSITDGRLTHGTRDVVFFDPPRSNPARELHPLNNLLLRLFHPLQARYKAIQAAEARKPQLVPRIQPRRFDFDRFDSEQPTVPGTDAGASANGASGAILSAASTPAV